MIGRTLPLALAAVFSATEAAPAQTLAAEFVANVPGRPVYLTAPAGDLERVFVVSKSGTIWIIKNGVWLTTPFLEIGAIVDDGGEGGLLGMAFHPDYANNDYFYVSYTANSGPGGPSVVSRFEVTANPDVADPGSEVIVFGPYPQQLQSHKAGAIQFGPNGKLFFSLGDGSNPSMAVDTAQDLTDPRGSILRFDVDIPFPHIPPDNPFVGQPGVAEEIWAYGLRNAFRIGVDSVTGDVYTGDVGASTREEISVIPGTSPGGDNLGWPCEEGTFCANGPGCDCTNTLLVDPVHEYDHSVGCAVMGGAVYRGSAIGGFAGTYIFSDFCTHKIWSFRLVGNQVTEFTDRTTELQAGSAAAPNNYVVSFGTDGAGELWMVNHYSGKIWRIVADCGTNNYCTAAPNSAGPGAQMNSGGTTSVSANDLILQASACPPNEFGLFFYGPDEAFLQVGNGNMCITGGLYRLPVVQSNGSGFANHSLDVGSPPHPTGQITAGSTWKFSYWYRDPGVPPSNFNFADGLSVTFCP